MHKILYIILLFPLIFSAQIDHVVFQNPVILNAVDATVQEPDNSICFGQSFNMDINNSPSSYFDISTAPTCYHAQLSLTTPGYVNFDSFIENVEFAFFEKDLINKFGMTASGNVLTAFESEELIDANSDYSYQAVAYHNGFGTPDGYEEFHQSDRFVGLRWIDGSDYFYGWIRILTTYNGSELICTISEYAVETSPNTPVLAGSVVSLNTPESLNETYSQAPNGIQLNWTPIADALACQVKGGLVGGNDPYSWIVSGIELDQKFLHGNSLIIGQEYQWKVRCATGINPYSGISDWSDYDYFIYNP